MSLDASIDVHVAAKGVITKDLLGLVGNGGVGAVARSSDCDKSFGELDKLVKVRVDHYDMLVYEHRIIP